MSSTLAEFISGIPNALLKQYEYEEGHVRSGDQLMHSSFLRVSYYLIYKTFSQNTTLFFC